MGREWSFRFSRAVAVHPHIPNAAHTVLWS